MGKPYTGAGIMGNNGAVAGRETTSTDGVLYLSPGLRAGTRTPEQREALDCIARHVNEALSIKEAVDCVWGCTAEFMPHDRICVSFLDESGERLTARCVRAAYEDLRLTEGYSQPMSSSSLRRLLGSGEVRIIRDLEIYLETHPDSDATRRLLAEGARTSITLPLRVRERNVGFMFFSMRGGGGYEREHAEFLMGVLDRISQAVEKAWIIKSLEESRVSYLRTLGFVAHELKAPLAGMTAKAITYLDGYLGDVDPTAGETVQSIMKNARYLTNMINDYIDLSRLESGEMNCHPRRDVSFYHEVLKAAKAMVFDAGGRGALRVKGPKGDVILDCDPDLLRTVMVNLFDNALKYGEKGRPVRAMISVEDGRLMIRVRNRGVGFTEEQAAKLFRRFSRLHQKGLEDRKGSGLGLYLTRGIVESHKGTLTAASEPGKWAEFIVSLPGARLQGR